MEKNKEAELEELKKEMAEVGEKNMAKEKKSRYVILRHEQKAERSRKQDNALKTQKSTVGGLWIFFGFLPFIIIGIIVWMIVSIKWEDYKSDCVIGRDSSDCLEGGGIGHPLWSH